MKQQNYTNYRVLLCYWGLAARGCGHATISLLITNSYSANHLFNHSDPTFPLCWSLHCRAVLCLSLPYCLDSTTEMVIEIIYNLFFFPLSSCFVQVFHVGWASVMDSALSYSAAECTVFHEVSFQVNLWFQMFHQYHFCRWRQDSSSGQPEKWTSVWEKEQHYQHNQSSHAFSAQAMNRPWMAVHVKSCMQTCLWLVNDQGLPFLPIWIITAFYCKIILSLSQYGCI